MQEACAQLREAEAPAELSQALLFRAYAEYRTGHSEAAAMSLTQAFAYAGQVGYDRMLVSEALALAEFLKAFERRSDVGHQAAGLLARARRLQTMRDAVELQAAPLAPTATPELRVRALGRAQAFKLDDEVPRAGWITQRTRELFFFLVDRAPIKRDEVLEIFWPDMAQARAASNLYQTVYRLRKVFGHELIALEEQYCAWLSEVSIDYDVRQFESKAREALTMPHFAIQRVSALAEALKLHGGEYLADLPVDWALARRRELAELYLDVSRAFAEELINLTRYIDARRVLEQALAIDMYDEQLHAQMLECLGRLGRVNAVVDHYVRYRERLRTEFGLDPPAHITALYARLLQ